ncbi:hypothetical protein EXN66_Car011655 [Channa argus]|uniref:Secreted protein n=1 Tax=Channa argus TaxID=215402 RepID=A0A6G1Q0I0_CHAAH|nr:hypothetical protein EXN66_Car011655 [Channa argus]
MEGQAIPGYLRACAFRPTFLLLCIVCSSPVTLVKKQTMAHIGPHCAPGSITQSPSAVLPPQTGGAIIAALYLQKERIHVQVSPLRDDYNGFLVSETRASEAFNVPPWLFSQCRCDQV